MRKKQNQKRGLRKVTKEKGFIGQWCRSRPELNFAHREKEQGANTAGVAKRNPTRGGGKKRGSVWRATKPGGHVEEKKKPKRCAKEK